MTVEWPADEPVPFVIVDEPIGEPVPFAVGHVFQLDEGDTGEALLPATEQTGTDGNRRGPSGYRCCKHCREDVVHDVPTDGHDGPCGTCDDPGAILRERATTAEAENERLRAELKATDEMRLASERRIDRLRDRHRRDREERDLWKARATIAQGKVARVAAALANHPTACDKHADGEAVSCGWKRAVLDVQRALGGAS